MALVDIYKIRVVNSRNSERYMLALYHRHPLISHEGMTFFGNLKHHIRTVYMHEVM